MLSSKVFILSLPLLLWDTLSAQQLSSDLLIEYSREHPDGGEMSGKCVWPNGAELGYEFGFTNKGNGRLFIGGQKIRIYDAHDDGCCYDENFLEINPVLANNIPLLVLSGTARWSDYKGQNIIKRESVLLVFATDNDGGLKLILRNKGAKWAEAIVVDSASPSGEKRQAAWTELIQRE